MHFTSQNIHILFIHFLFFFFDSSRMTENIEDIQGHNE